MKSPWKWLAALVLFIATEFIPSYKFFMKPGNPPLQSNRVLNQLRECIRCIHYNYSLSTEQIYVYWVRFFISWYGRNGQMQHPRDIGVAGVEAFLSMLETERRVSAHTHDQALSALLFLYRKVLGIDLPWLNDINRLTQKRRIPSVLTKDEVADKACHHYLHHFLVHLMRPKRDHISSEVTAQAHQALCGGHAVAVLNDRVGFAVDEVPCGFLRRVLGQLGIAA